MVDAERLHRLLRLITGYVGELDAYGDVPADLLDDRVTLGYVKYTFVCALEAAIDAAQHVAASEGLPPPDDNAEVMRLLARHGYLASELGEPMASAVGFRNVLVHQYADVDDTKVVAHLGELGDLRRFVADLSELLDDASSS